MSRTGKSPTSTASGRTNTPYLSEGESKYATPFTVPLEFPQGSSRSTPTKYPTPRSIILPTNLTSPRASFLFNSLQRSPTLIDSATSFKYQVSQLAGLATVFGHKWGCFSSSCFFHFLKFSGRLSQSCSEILYFSTDARSSISLWMEKGFMSTTQMIYPFPAPYHLKVLLSSSILQTIIPFSSLRTSFIMLARDPQRFSMFSLMERMDWSRSQQASSILVEEMLCSSETQIDSEGADIVMYNQHLKMGRVYRVSQSDIFLSNG